MYRVNYGEIDDFRSRPAGRTASVGDSLLRATQAAASAAARERAAALRVRGGLPPGGGEGVAWRKPRSGAVRPGAGHSSPGAGAGARGGRGLSRKPNPADETKTYGYHRASVLSAFVNALTLVALSVWILYESVVRFRQ